MELSSDQEEELRKVLRQNPRGISTDALYNSCTTFEDKQELTLGLHTAKNQGWCYKQSNLNFLVGVEVPEADPVKEEVGVRAAAKALRPALKHLSSEEAKSATVALAHEPAVTPEPEVTPVVALVEVEAVDPWAASRAKFSEPQADAEQKPTTAPRAEDKESKAPGSRGFGCITHRLSGRGLAALVLYRWRHAAYWLTLQQLAEITGLATTVVAQGLYKLVDDGYIRRDDTTFRKPRFKWSELYRYPFPDQRETDGAVLKFKTAHEYDQSKLPDYAKEKVVEPVVQTAPPAPKAVEEAVGPLKLGGEVGPIGVPGVLGPSGCPKGVSTQSTAEVYAMSNLDLVVRQIDFELSSHRHQIEVLENMRSFLVRPQAQ